jgi:arginine deiminase
MYQEKSFCIFSEIGKLKQVMLHRPGIELDRLTTENKDELLFDDLIWLEAAQKEHDEFASILRREGCEVLYFQDCVADVIENKEVRRSLLKEVFNLECVDKLLADALTEYFMELPARELAGHLIGGYSKDEAAKIFKTSLSLVSLVTNDTEFIIHPIPNLYFQRDPAMTVGNYVVLGQMSFEARRREPLYWKYIVKNHPRFEKMGILFGDEPGDMWPNKIEGGDFLVLSDHVMAIGVGQRTNPATAQRIGSRLAKLTSIKRILAFEIPKERYCMHLDTVFTMVDKDKFTIYPPLLKTLKVWQLDYNDDGELLSLTQAGDWQAVLADSLGVDKVKILETRGKDEAETIREQWHDGCNTLAVAPGKVVTYNRNTNSNRLLRENGIEVLELAGPELGRGRGGPRCMSMPLNREPVK